MTTATYDVTDPTFAVTLAERMDEAIARQAAAMRMLITCKQAIATSREQIKTMEAEVIVNGGVGEIVIDGRNAEQRAAQLTAALNRDPMYSAEIEKLRAVEREAQECEADIDSTTNEIRYCRLLLEFGTSVNLRLSGVEAGNAFRR